MLTGLSQNGRFDVCCGDLTATMGLNLPFGKPSPMVASASRVALLAIRAMPKASNPRQEGQIPRSTTSGRNWQAMQKGFNLESLLNSLPIAAGCLN